MVAAAFLSEAAAHDAASAELDIADDGTMDGIGIIFV